MQNVPAPSRRRRWPWVLAAVALGLAAVVAAAPSLIAATSLRDQILARVFAKVNGQVTAQNASWGWFSSTVLEGVVIRDPRGAVVLEVSHLALQDKTVGGLLFYPHELGTISIEHPQVTIEARPEGLNLAEVFGRFLEKSDAQPPRISKLVVRTAHVTFSDVAANTSLELSAVSADIEAEGPGLPSKFDLVALLTVNSPKNFGLYQPPIHISAQGVVDPPQDEVRLEVLALRPEAGPASLEAKGRISNLSHQPRLELTGDVDYDLPQLAQRVRPFLGGKLELAGQGKQQFSLTGPLAARSPAGIARLAAPIDWNGGPIREPFLANLQEPDAAAGEAQPAAETKPAETKPIESPTADPLANIPGIPQRPASPGLLPPMAAAPGLEWLTGLEGQAKLGWKSAAAFGVNVGEAALQGKLAGGWLSLAATQVQVAEGEVDLRTRLHIAGSVPQLIVDPGRLVHRVRLTPEACAQGMRFIAPMLADATEVTGDFSLDLSHCRIPLGPGQPALEGTLTIHAVEVGAGPMLAEVARLLRLENSRLRVVDQAAIYFALADNRVYHEGMQFQLGDLKIRSRGYVGLADESLNLVLEVPFIDHLLPPGPLGQHLRGKAILVPVGGTLKKPKIEVGEIARVNFAALGGGGSGQGGVLESLLGTPVNVDNMSELLQGLLERRREARAAQGEAGQGVVGPEQPAPAPDRPVLNLLRDRLRKRLGKQPEPPPTPMPPAPAPPGSAQPKADGPREF